MLKSGQGYVTLLATPVHEEFECQEDSVCWAVADFTPGSANRYILNSQSRPVKRISCGI